MKIESISIQNFKLFEKLEVSFKNATLQEVSSRFLVLGDNGTGKTTLLQAIALPLALATGQVSSVAEFDWVGFLAARYARWGAPRIQLDISFDDEEIETASEVVQRWEYAEKGGYNLVLPGRDCIARLVLNGTSCYVDNQEITDFIEIFRSRYYAQQLLKTDPTIRALIPKLPGVFWFDQFRNLGSRTYLSNVNDDTHRESNGRVAYDFGVARLRRYLNGWQLAQQAQTKLYTFDPLTELERLYKRVFAGRSFAGVEPMPGVDAPTAEDFYFLLNDGHRTYDIEEMSAGEQAVFPILYEFIRQQIAHSVVLIDEVDLNLHPPIAQLLVSQLPKIGPSCQFIITTHSESVSNIISQEETYRLQGGSLCL